MTSTRQTQSTILDIAFRSYLQDALHASETKLRNIVEHSVDGVVLVDQEGHIIMWSPGQERITGISAGHALNCLIWDVQLSISPVHRRNDKTHEQLRRRFLDAVRPENGDEWSTSLEIEIEPVHGKQQIVQQFMFAIPTGDGLRVGYVMRDVTGERQKTRNLLRRNAELNLLNRVNRVLASSLDMQQVRKTVLSEVTQLLDASGASIWLSDGSSSKLVCAQSLDRSGIPIPDAALSTWSAITDMIYRDSKVLALRDALQDGWIASDITLPDGFPPIRSLIGVPIQFKDSVLGVLLVVDGQPDRFSPADVNLLEPIAAMAALAFENAHLHATARKLAALQERQRLAVSLHDAINQSLFSAGLIAEVLPLLIEHDPEQAGRSIQDMRKLLRGAVCDLRAVLAEMQPTLAQCTTFDDLLGQLASRYTGRTGTTVAINIATKASFAENTHEILFGLCSEIFTNIAKHAHATQVWVSLVRKQNCFEIVIRDNGIGFDTTQVLAGHYGLVMLQQQSKSIGAELYITSEIGQGTEVRICVPSRAE